MESNVVWEHPATLAEYFEAGRRARCNRKRSQLAQLTTTGRNPLGILAEQNATRVHELVPLRAERMSQSPFVFYRGTAALMAADLGASPHSGILVASCGDAHVANFGFYASPQRTLVFDLNDFDEAAWAPWEWDLKRLVASIVVSGQSSGRSQKVIDEAVLQAVELYVSSLSALVGRTPLERFFTHFEVSKAGQGIDKKSRVVLQAAIDDAEKRTGVRAARRLTQYDEHGRVMFVERPPTMTRIDDERAEELQMTVGRYLASANADIRVLMAHYVPADAVRRVVGVGSVGTRCYLVAFQAGDNSVLLLQAKEANESVLAQYGGIAQPSSLTSVVEEHGQGVRVVALQRVLQAFSDPFLGYLRGTESDLYVRQFHDMKGGIETEELDTQPFLRYGSACAVTLARAHAQSPTAAQVVGYIGDGGKVSKALLEWAYLYAELSRRDYEAFVAANKVT